MEDIISDIVLPQTADRIFQLQNRCIACGSTLYLQIHHRIFRSEAEFGLQNFLDKMKCLYENSYRRVFKSWHLHSIQNLAVLCQMCHEGEHGRGVHGGNMKLRKLLRYSFTCPITGFNVSYYKSKPLYS